MNSPDDFWSITPVAGLYSTTIWNFIFCPLNVASKTHSPALVIAPVLFGGIATGAAGVIVQVSVPVSVNATIPSGWVNVIEIILRI